MTGFKALVLKQSCQVVANIILLQMIKFPNRFSFSKSCLRCLWNQYQNFEICTRTSIANFSELESTGKELHSKFSNPKRMKTKPKCDGSKFSKSKEDDDLCKIDILNQYFFLIMAIQTGYHKHFCLSEAFRWIRCRKKHLQ